MIESQRSRCNQSLATFSSAAALASPASTDAAPPIKSNVLVIREANVLVVKLPVSSNSAGFFATKACSNSCSKRSRIGAARPRRVNN